MRKSGLRSSYASKFRRTPAHQHTILANFFNLGAGFERFRNNFPSGRISLFRCFVTQVPFTGQRKWPARLFLSLASLGGTPRCPQGQPHRSAPLLLPQKTERSAYSSNRVVSFLLGAMLTLPAASSSWANGSTPVFNQDCSVLETTVSTLDLGRVTTLILRNNDNFKKLDLSGLENLTTLVIKSNSQLRELQIPDLPQLKNITVENNRLTKIQYNSKPVNIELLNLKHKDNNSFLEFLSKWMIKWKAILLNEDATLTLDEDNRLTLIIKDNNCLSNINLNNLNTLRELRIEGNDRLETIYLNFPPP